MLKAITATVIGEQEAADAIPLTLHPGDEVVLGRPHPERPGYVWAEDGQISAGWVPMSVIDAVGDRGRANAEYCSAELSVSPGDQVRVMWKDPARGAWWCEDRHSERGWIRADLLQADDPE